jgi:hypothetical protein
MILDLSNREFLLLFGIGAAIIFIIISVTHTHDVPADEAALKAADKIEATLEKIRGIDDNAPELHNKPI